MSRIFYFDPPCAAPSRMPSPFARAPHPIARHAAERMLAELPRTSEGKMFGVLVVRDRDDRIGYVRAFSGMLDGSWNVDGFAPPVFDAEARDAVWPSGSAELAALTAQIVALDFTNHDALAEMDRRHTTALDELLARHRASRSQRRAARNEGGESRELDQASRGDGAEKRRMREAHTIEREPLARAVAAVDDAYRKLDDERAAKSRFYLRALFDTYVLSNTRNERRKLRDLFEDEPPGGAGDCAAPKLLAHAFREGLTPIALAEVWVGPPPLDGGRHHGVFYPACRGKCGPVLAHMLDGIVEPPPEFGVPTVDASEPKVVFEDDWLAIVDKPCGLLSVPGRSGALQDSVQTRLVARYREAYVVHRLDLDASGVMLIAKDRATHAALQRLFAERAITKQYIAWLDGDVTGDGGVIELALRVDLDDRPRQIYDPIHGKPARTEWRVLERANGLTKVELFPRTGRTHQLRVHAAHPLGIGTPIVGDALYGRESTRLLLHARHLEFVHPHTKRRLEVAREPAIDDGECLQRNLVPRSS